MKFFKKLIISFVFINLFAWGQELRAQEAPSNQLYQSLGDLRKNVDQLSVANQTLLLKNEKMKASLKDLQIKYQKLMQESLQLEEAQSKQQKAIAPKTQQIDQLNKSLSDLKTQEDALNQQIQNSQDQIAVLKAQDARLNNSAVQSEGDSDASSTQIAEILQEKQKHKLAILKLISESQDHQALLQEKLLDYKKNVPNEFNFESKKENLQSQISLLQDEITQLNSLANSSAPVWSEEQIHQLEASVASLEKNRDELRDLLRKMQQKTQKIVQSQDKSADQLKLEANIEELKREAKNSRIDLEELQQQMIDLDKRKSYLEALLQD